MATRTRVLKPNDRQYAKPDKEHPQPNIIYNEDPKAPYPASGTRKKPKNMGPNSDLPMRGPRP